VPRLTGGSANHVVLTISDLDRSVAWYIAAFGLVVVGDEQSVPSTSKQPLRYRSLFDPVTMTYVVGLMEHSDGLGDTFDHRRAGLDHFALHVPELADLEAWAEHLDAVGVNHSGIHTVDYGSAIAFTDPDGIQLELNCPNLDFWVPRVIASASGATTH